MPWARSRILNSNKESLGVPFSDFVFLFSFCRSFGPVDARDTCVGPCVVAGAYAGVIDSARCTELN